MILRVKVLKGLINTNGQVNLHSWYKSQTKLTVHQQGTQGPVSI